MKILHLSSAKTWRGGEQQIAYLIEVLRTWQIELHVFCVAGGAFEQWCLAHQIPVTTYVKTSSFSLKIARSVKQVCQTEQITLVHAHDSHAHTYAYLAGQLFGNPTPMVVSRRVDFPVSNSFLSKRKYNYKGIQRIICISEKIKSVLAPAINDPSKLTVVHSGVDLDKFNHSPNTSLHQEFQLPLLTLLIGNVAAIADHKDYFTFVDTVALLVQTGINTHFFIIGGDGGQQQAIEEYIAEQNLQAHITLTGFRADIVDVLPQLDVLLFTSKEEGLGTTVLDAFAAGTPVVATRAGGIPEMIEHGQNGLLANIGDAATLAQHVQNVTTDKILRQRLIQNARKTVEGFSKTIMAEKVLKVYRSIEHSNT